MSVKPSVIRHILQPNKKGNEQMGIHDPTVLKPNSKSPDDYLEEEIEAAAIEAGICPDCKKENKDCSCIGGNKAFLRLVNYAESMINKFSNENKQS